MIRALFLVACVAATPSFINNAAAQSYPVRPITIVVPFPAGGPTDALTRILAERMTALLGQTLVVENITGAAGTIGAGQIARATPDGHALVMGNVSTHVVNGAVYPLTYDLVKDFEPIALVASNPRLIVAEKTLPADNLKEFVACVEGQRREGAARNSGCRKPRAYRRCICCRLQPAPTSDLCPIAAPHRSCRT